MKRKQVDVCNQIITKSKKYAANTPKQSVEDEVKDNASKTSNLRKATAADKERKRIKRKLKRQKEREMKEKQEKEELGKAAKLSALSYLRQWNDNRSEWAFKKKRQLWLLTHIYSLEDVSDDCFQILLHYMESLQGLARERLIKKSEEVIQTFEKDESTKVVEEEGSSNEEVNVQIFERAKSVLQLLV